MASIVLMIFPAIMTFAAVMDLFTMTIPNKVPVALAGAFLVAALFAGLGATEFLAHLGAGALVLAASIVLFALGGFGGGDGKLLSAAALWIGFEGLVTFLAFVGIAGGVLAIAILLYRRIPAIEVLPLPHWAVKLHERGSGIPYGVAIAAGALLIYPETAWVTALSP